MVKFVPVGINALTDGGPTMCTPLSVTVSATALPVELRTKPSKHIEFGNCAVGSCSVEEIQLHNHSSVLGLEYRCRQPAHYKCDPSSGHIGPGEHVKLNIAFLPRQLGQLNFNLLVDVMGPQMIGQTKQSCIHTVAVELLGTSSTGAGAGHKLPAQKVALASPNNLAASIRPHDQKKPVLTKYTRVPRHTYVDPDYTYSDAEQALVRQHKDFYKHYIRQRSDECMWKLKERDLSDPAFFNPTDLSMPPAHGMHPPRLKAPPTTTSATARTFTTLADTPMMTQSMAGEESAGMLTSKKLKQATSAQLHVLKHCASKPSSSEMLTECRTILSPEELNRIVFEPAVLDFQHAVIGAVAENHLSVRNYLTRHVCIKLETAGAGLLCPTYPPKPSLTLILPPQSSTELPFTLQQDRAGLFERSLQYSINTSHTHHLPVKAWLVPLSLSLSASSLTLTQPLPATPAAGLRGSVAVHNEHRVPAKFRWYAQDGVDSSIFFVMHPAGVVPPQSSLQCEFICQPSFSSASTAQFKLAVENENTVEDSSDGSVSSSSLLSLQAQFGLPRCSFREQRVLFGAVPLNLTTTRTVHLENSGEQHIYFKVADPSPVPGLHVFPQSGCIPVGGTVPFQLLLHPESPGKFDAKLSVRLRQGKTLSLKLVGSVEEPSVSIDKELFRFGGVYTEAKASVPFSITNKKSTRTQLTFNLSFMSDFSLVLPERDDPYAEVAASDWEAERDDHVYTLDLPGKSTADCRLEFTPKEVAAYDFLLPVLVNGLRPPTPPPSPWPPSHTHPSKVSICHNDTSASFTATPTRRVLATGLRPPLHVIPTETSFDVPPDYIEEAQSPLIHPKAMELTNVSERPLTWSIDCSGIQRVEDKTFWFAVSGAPLAQPPRGLLSGSLQPRECFKLDVCCEPAHHGIFTASVPLLLNGDTSQIYRTLTLSAKVTVGCITVSPSHIAVQPVPLRVSVTAQFSVSLHGFSGPVNLKAEIPAMEEYAQLSVAFPKGSCVEDCSLQHSAELQCVLEFSSKRPLSRTDHITFTDVHTGRRRRVPFTVAADNSMFTVYTFLAQNVSTSSVSAAVPDHGDCSPVPTLFLHSAGRLREPLSSMPSACSLTESVSAPSCLSGSVTFGDIYLQDIILAIVRWISVNGWSNGMKNITSPTDLRVKVGQDIPRAGMKQRSSLHTSKGLLVDMLNHICGRLPPGIPVNPPPSTTPTERVHQQYSTFTTVLTFLKNQGALIWSVFPESLLAYADWKQWRQDNGSTTGNTFCPTTEQEFELLSRQAWTHLLMQIIKVLVLPRAAQIPKTLSTIVSAMDPLASNVYSPPERVLLAWLNHHYLQQKSTVFKGQELLLERKVINFDIDIMDSTVLACVLAAYCPFLVSSYFSGMYSEPSTPEQCSHNAILIIKALQDIGIGIDCQTNDLCSPNPVFLLLLCCTLYKKLPSFKPKSTVAFQGILHHPITQLICIENPSTKPLVYQLMLRGEGSEDFSIADKMETISLPRHKTAHLRVSYQARSLSPSSAVLLLVARSGRPTLGSTLAFTLNGSATAAEPKCSTLLSAALYQPQTVVLEVVSPFSRAGHFAVTLCESSDQALLFTTSPHTKRRSGVKCPTVIPVLALERRTDDGMQLFNTSSSTVYLEPSGSAPVHLQFVPLKLQPRHCSVILSNPTLGDVLLSVSAAVKMPYPLLPKTVCLDPHTLVNKETTTVHLKAHAGQSIREELVISSRNVSFERASLEVCKWQMSDDELKHRTLSGSLNYAALRMAVDMLGIDNTAKNHRNSLPMDSDELVFSVEGGNEYFLLPESIAVPADQNGSSTLPVEFCAEVEGQYECHVVLRSKHDVRVLVIESTVLALGRHAELEFTTPALQPLTQDIPLVNPSTVDWPLSACLSGVGFSGPESITVKALATSCYPLTFNPRKSGLVKGLLCLANTDDGTEHTYQLRGMAERPLAQDRITLQAQAKKSITHILHVPNHNERTTLFHVESSLPFVTGTPSVTIGGGDVVDYPLSLLPKRQGLFTGAVAFVAQALSSKHSLDESRLVPCCLDGAPHHVWFHIECCVDPAPPDCVLPLACHTLSSMTTPLPLDNPHPHPITLTVLVEGCGLSGPGTIEVVGGGEASYPLSTSPMVKGESSGRVVFNGSPDGEFWYQIKLTALDPRPVETPEVSCELGRSCQQMLTLHNPLNEPVQLTSHSSNTKYFIITGLNDREITVEAQSSTQVAVQFKPSRLGETDQKADISFSSEQFGTQIFHLRGRGLPPSSMDASTVNAGLHSNAVHIVSFTNPLDSATRFSVSLLGRDREHFCLLVKRHRSILLHPGVTLDVPIMFAPEAMHRHEVSIIIAADETEESARSEPEPVGPLAWTFPIVGQPELQPYPSSSAPKLACRAKERIEQQLKVTLVGSLSETAAQLRPLTPGKVTFATPISTSTVSGCGAGLVGSKRNASNMVEAAKETYTHQLVCSDEVCAPLVRQATGVKLLRQEYGCGGDEAMQLMFSIVFAPPKAFSCVAELHVSSSSGGLWKFPFQFRASTAAPDDTVILEALGLNKETQVGFRLNSMLEHPVAFTAHLAPGSDREITVHPTHGDLAPRNTQGTLLCISYRPTKYGRDHQAKLIVKSDSSEWCYAIVGKPPSYTAPTNTPSKVKHTASPPARSPHCRKNFVQENMHLVPTAGLHTK